MDGDIRGDIRGFAFGCLRVHSDTGCSKPDRPSANSNCNRNHHCRRIEHTHHNAADRHAHADSYRRAADTQSRAADRDPDNRRHRHPAADRYPCPAGYVRTGSPCVGD